MTLLHVWSTAIKGLRTNLGRSLLTILGIIIGVAAIVLVMALGDGAQSVILNQVQGVGGDIIVVRPGRQPTGPSDFAESLFSNSLKQGDLDALNNPGNAPDVLAAYPSVIVPGAVSYKENVYRPTTLGWTDDGAKSILHLDISDGDFFTADDTRAQAKVAVIGSKVKDELFGDNEAVGQYIRIKQTALRVVGVLPKSGQMSILNPDEIVIMPYTTAQHDLLGISYFHELQVRAISSAVVNQAADEIRTVLRERHNITDTTKDDFYVVTEQDIVSRISTVTSVLTLFLAAIAGISLVVGGVGIMNIMLVSVTERTREIGLRKAVGATNRDILQQFLGESLILTTFGGLVGTSIAVGLAFIVSQVATYQFNITWPFQLPLLAICLGVGTAVTIGLTFGLYPALKAAKKDPIEALRYE